MITRRRQSMYNAWPAEVRQLGYCQDVTHFARRFVDSAVTAALRIITVMDHRSSLGHLGIRWPTCGSMSVRNGLQCVEEEMLRWNQLPALKKWMFCVQFVSLNREGSVEFYLYQAVWSAPTPACPEPYVTVSVFFHVAASRVQPPHFPADVSYVFEGHQFVHRLDTGFRPKWLYDVFDMKTMLFRTFTF